MSLRMPRLTGLFVLLSGGELRECSSCRLGEAQRGQGMGLVGPLADVPVPGHTHDLEKKDALWPKEQEGADGCQLGMRIVPSDWQGVEELRF